MAVTVNTAVTANSKVLREDLARIAELIAPTETPFLSAIGKGTAKGVYHEWTTIDLQPATDSNQVPEGDNPENDVINEGVRLGNYCQLSDKIAQISSTRQAVDEVGDLGSMAKQISLKVKELRLDMEKHALSRKVATGSGTRVAASVPSFIQTNVLRGVGGSSPTLSGTTYGHPNVQATDGTLRDLEEEMVRDVISQIWSQGGDPTHVFVGPKQKTKISAFTGNATAFRESTEKKLVSAIDILVTDFGEVQIVPSRLIRNRDLLVLDPTKISVDYLQNVKQEPLAKNGHSDRRMVSVEYTLSVSNEKALGGVFDLAD